MPNILVLGPVLIDEYVAVSADRVDQTSALPVLSGTYPSAWCWGGAANTAVCLARLGCEVTLVSHAPKGASFEQGSYQAELLNEPGLECAFNVPPRLTDYRKLRYIDDNHKLVARVDYDGPKFALPCKLLRAAMTRKIDVVVVCDYGRGAITSELMETLHKLTSQQVIVDPNPDNVLMYRGCDTLVPSLSQFRQIIRDQRMVSTYPIVDTMLEMSRVLSVSNIVVTCGGGGARCLIGRNFSLIQGSFLPVASTVGAGDVFTSVFAYECANGSTYRAAVQSAIAAASYVVRNNKFTCSLGFSAYIDAVAVVAPARKVLARDKLLQYAADAKRDGLSVGLTNGVFDLLHLGHMNMLAKAGSCVDRLIVLVDDDGSASACKGEGRPINSARQREQMVAHLPGGSVVGTFSTDTLPNLLATIKPEVYFKGGEYANTKDFPGCSAIAKLGISVKFLEMSHGLSTTEVIRKIEQRS